MPEVVVIGDVDTDIMIKVPRIPTWDEGILAEAVYECPGGKGANTAAALSRLGTPSGIMSFAGDDRYGRIAREGLERHGVDISHLDIIADESTYYCIMMLDPSGEKAIIVVATPIIYPDPEYIQAHSDYLKEARHVHAIGLNPGRVVVGLQIARQAGCTTSVDLDSAYAGYEACKQIIPQASIVFVNERGAGCLFPDIPLEDAARRILEMGPELVVITRGRRGVISFDGAGFVEVPGFQVSVKDTTGAGDCFAAAFIHQYMQGNDVKQGLVFASAAAALSTLEIGGQSALPAEVEVINFLNNCGIFSKKGG